MASSSSIVFFNHSIQFNQTCYNKLKQSFGNTDGQFLDALLFHRLRATPSSGILRRLRSKTPDIHSPRVRWADQVLAGLAPGQLHEIKDMAGDDPDKLAVALSAHVKKMKGAGKGLEAGKGQHKGKGKENTGTKGYKGATPSKGHPKGMSKGKTPDINTVPVPPSSWIDPRVSQSDLEVSTPQHGRTRATLVHSGGRSRYQVTEDDLSADKFPKPKADTGAGSSRDRLVRAKPLETGESLGRSL